VFYNIYDIYYICNIITTSFEYLKWQKSIGNIIIFKLLKSSKAYGIVHFMMYLRDTYDLNDKL